jgi:hypothetical protein
MGSAGQVARVGERVVTYTDLVWKPEEKRPLGRPRLDGRIILKWIFQEVEWGQTGLI